MHQEHPLIAVPSSLDVNLWRYMDIAKFLDLCQRSTLFFSRSDLLGDPFEGSLPLESFNSRETKLQVVLDGIRSDLKDKFRTKIDEFHDWIRMWTFVSCWHANQDESDAMWKIYSLSSSAVAIRTTFRKLSSQLSEDTYFGVVQYIDYEKDYVVDDSTIAPFFHKRRSFAHENEVRAVMQKTPYDGETLLLDEKNTSGGLSVPIRLDLLIDTIYVSPLAPAWFTEVVERIVNDTGLAIPVTQSQLTRSPLR